jgi:hypothetical protein
MTPLEATIIAILTAIPGILVAIATLIATIKNGNQLTAVGGRLDGRLTELLASSVAKATAEALTQGNLQGIQTQKDIQKGLDDQQSSKKP